MDKQTLTNFLKWCSVINIGLLALSVLMVTVFADLTYSIHGAMFDLTREAFNAAIYSAIGMYKILILVFNLVPYIALKVIED